MPTTNNLINSLNVAGTDLSVAGTDKYSGHLAEVRVDKINLTKAVRQAVGCGLHEAKKITDQFFDDMEATKNRIREIDAKAKEANQAADLAKALFINLDADQRVIFNASLYAFLQQQRFTT